MRRLRYQDDDSEHDEEKGRPQQTQESLDDLNSFLEQRMETTQRRYQGPQNTQRTSLHQITSLLDTMKLNKLGSGAANGSKSEATLPTAARTFETRGINTMAVPQSSKMSNLQQSICNLDATDFNQIQSLASQVHDAQPLETETRDMISVSMTAPKNLSYRAKIAGKKKVTTRKPDSQQSANDFAMTALYEWHEKDSMGLNRPTTAEGLYRRAQRQSAAPQETEQMREMKYDFTPKALDTMREEANRPFNEALHIQNKIKAESASLTEPQKFGSTIPKTWSSSGLYLQSGRGQKRAYPGIEEPRNAPDEESNSNRLLRWSLWQEQQQQQKQLKKPLLGGNRPATQLSSTQKPLSKTAATPSKKQSDPNTMDVHFFESPSKHIPLKVFNQLYTQSYSNQSEMMTVQPKGGSKDAKIQMVKKWFSSLTLQEQSITLTIVDKDLVNLFKAMYKAYESSGHQDGDFTARLDHCDSVKIADQYKKVGNYQLLYSKRSNLTLRSDYLQKRTQAANMLIEQTRIVSINEHNDALTLDVSFIECNSFFTEIMKLIDQEFLQRDYKTIKTTASAITGSLLVGQTYQQTQQLVSDGLSIGGAQQANTQRTAKEKPYFIVRDEHKPIFAASSNSVVAAQHELERGQNDDSAERNALHTPGYKRMVNQYRSKYSEIQEHNQGEKDENHVTFARCLLLAYEKAINIQFQDYLDKMQQAPVQSFFFIGKNELQDNIFSEDLKVSNFWQKLDESRKRVLLQEPLKKIMKDLLLDYNENHRNCANIRESEGEDDSGELRSRRSSSKSDFEQFEYEEAMSMLNRPFQYDRSSSPKTNDFLRGAGGTQLTQLPTEYTEFTGTSYITATGDAVPQFNQALVKQRRTRAQRSQKSGTNTNSSSGINVGATNVSSSFYDYNTNQLTGQYGNGGSNLGQGGHGQADDLELGIGGPYSINYLSGEDDQVDEEQLDPESQLPLSQTHFSNRYGGLDQPASSFQPEESKEVQPKRKKPKLKIELQVPEQSPTDLENEARNDLFDKQNPQSILFKQKQAIIQKGLACKNEFKICLKFIKSLSANKTFEYALKEHQGVSGVLPQQVQSQIPQKNQSKKKKGKQEQSAQNVAEALREAGRTLSQWELTNTTVAFNIRMQTTVLKHLVDECQKSILEDLFVDTEDAKTTRNAPQVNQQSTQLQTAGAQSSTQTGQSYAAQGSNSSAPQNTSDPAQTQATDQSQGGSNAQSQKKNKKKQKRKRNKKQTNAPIENAANDPQAQQIENQVAEKAERQPQTESKNQQPEQTKTNQDRKQETKTSDPLTYVQKASPQEFELRPLMKTSDSAAKPKKAKLSDDENEEYTEPAKVGTSSKNGQEEEEYIGEAELQQMLKVHQGVEQVKDHDQILLDMENQLEKLCTAERMLDDNCDADLVIDTIGLKFSSDKLDQSSKVDPQYLEMLKDKEDFDRLARERQSNEEEMRRNDVIDRYEKWLQCKQGENSSETLVMQQKSIGSNFGKGKLQQVSEDEEDSDNYEIERALRNNPIQITPDILAMVDADSAKYYQRFKEERRGLLSDEIHLDKYPQETLMELQALPQVADEETIEEIERQKMIDYALYENFQAHTTKKSDESFSARRVYEKMIGSSNGKSAKRVVIPLSNEQKNTAQDQRLNDSVEDDSEHWDPTATAVYKDKKEQDKSVDSEVQTATLNKLYENQFQHPKQPEKETNSKIQAEKNKEEVVQNNEQQQPNTKRKMNKKNRRRNQKRTKQQQTQIADPTPRKAVEEEPAKQESSNQPSVEEEKDKNRLKTASIGYVKKSGHSVGEVLMEDDVEEIPFDDNIDSALPDPDVQPPRVNTLFSDPEKPVEKTIAGVETQQIGSGQKTTTQKRSKKEERKLRKAISAMQNNQSLQKQTSKTGEANGDECFDIEDSTDEVAQNERNRRAEATDALSDNEEEQKSFVIDLTRNLIVNTVQSVQEELQKSASNTAAVPDTSNQQQNKQRNNKKKRKQQRAADKKAQEKLEREEKLKKNQEQVVSSQKKKISQISSKSSTTNSLANIDSSVPKPWPPFVASVNKHHKFKVDEKYSDRVSIPQRGTSTGSYHQREQEHSHLLEELDSLFPAHNKGSTTHSPGSFKIRSSTLSKTRQPPYLGGHVGAFTTSAKQANRNDSPDSQNAILLKNAVKDADIQSQQHDLKPGRTKFLQHDDDDLLEDMHSMSPRKHPNLKSVGAANDQKQPGNSLLANHGQDSLQQEKQAQNKAQQPVQVVNQAVRQQAHAHHHQQHQAAQITVLMPGQPQQPLSKAQQKKQRQALRKQQALLAQQNEEAAKAKAEQAKEGANPAKPAQNQAQMEESKKPLQSNQISKQTTANQQNQNQATPSIQKQHQHLSSNQSESQSKQVVHPQTSIEKPQKKATTAAATVSSSIAVSEPSPTPHQAQAKKGSTQQPTPANQATSKSATQGPVIDVQDVISIKPSNAKDQLVQASNYTAQPPQVSKPVTETSPRHSQQLAAKDDLLEKKYFDSKQKSARQSSNLAQKDESSAKAQTSQVAVEKPKQGTQGQKKSSSTAQKQSSKPMLQNNFSSYENMFESVFGAQSISSKPAPGNDNEAAKKTTAAKDQNKEQAEKKQTPQQNKSQNQSKANTQQQQQSQQSQQQNVKKPEDNQIPFPGVQGKEKSQATQSSNQPVMQQTLQSKSKMQPIARSQASISEVFGNLAAQNQPSKQPEQKPQGKNKKTQQLSLSQSAEKPSQGKSDSRNSSVRNNADLELSTKEEKPNQNQASNLTSNLQVAPPAESNLNAHQNDSHNKTTPGSTKNGGIGIMMTPSRSAFTQSMPQNQQRAPQHVQQHAHQTNYQFQQKHMHQQQYRSVNNHQQHQHQHQQQQQYYTQSHFQTPQNNLLQTNAQPFQFNQVSNLGLQAQPGPLMPSHQQQQNQQPAPQQTLTVQQNKLKQQYVSSYFQTTVPTNSEQHQTSIQTATTAEDETSSTAITRTQQQQSETPLAETDQRRNRGVQFPFQQANQPPQPANSQQNENQVSSAVQMTVNLNIVQTTNQFVNVPQQQLPINQAATPQNIQAANIVNQQQQINKPLPQGQVAPSQIQMNLQNDNLIQQYIGLFQKSQQTPVNGGPLIQGTSPFIPGQQQPQGHLMFQNQPQMMIPPNGQAHPQGFYQPMMAPFAQFQQPNMQNMGQQPQRSSLHLLQQPVTNQSPKRLPVAHAGDNQISAAYSESQQQQQKSPAGKNQDLNSVETDQVQNSTNKTSKKESESPIQKPTISSKIATTASQNLPLAQQQQQQHLQQPQPQQTQQMNQPLALFPTPPPHFTPAAQSNGHIDNTNSYEMQAVAKPFSPQQSRQLYSPQQTGPNQQHKGVAFMGANNFGGGANIGGPAPFNNSQQPQHFQGYNSQGAQPGVQLPFQFVPQHQQQSQQHHQMYPQQQPAQFFYPQHAMLQQPHPQLGMAQGHQMAVFEPQSLSNQVGFMGIKQIDKAIGSLAQTEAACKAREDRFFEIIGTQIIAMQEIIERRLAEVEPLRQDCFTKLFDLVKQTYTEVPQDQIEFKVYGSMATKLAIDTSDMDISIHGVVNSQGIVDCQQLRTLTVEAMERIHSHLDPLEWIDSNMLIDKASVPVIKLVINLRKLDNLRDQDDRIFKEENDAPDNSKRVNQLKIDLIFNDILKARQVTDMYTGETYIEEGDSQSNHKCAEYVKTQIARHPLLKPLAITLKKYLSLKSLNSAFSGTLSSYGLVLMLLALIKDFSVYNQSLESSALDPKLFVINLGKTFSHFLQVFGQDYSSQHLMIDENSEFQENQSNIQSQLGMFQSSNTVGLQVMDPVNTSNNVGKQTYNFNFVQDQLQVTKNCLLVRFQEYQQRVSHGDELLRRDALVDRAIEAKSKRNSGKRGNAQNTFKEARDQSLDEKIQSLATDELFIFLLQEQSEASGSMAHTATPFNPSGAQQHASHTHSLNQPLPSKKDLQVEKLLARSLEQLREDKAHLCEQLEANRQEIRSYTDGLLSSIVMIKSDLSAILNDEVEEKQKIMSQFTKERNATSWMRPLERIKINAESVALLSQTQAGVGAGPFFQPQPKMNQMMQRPVPGFMNQNQMSNHGGFDPGMMQQPHTPQNNFFQNLPQQLMEQLANVQQNFGQYGGGNNQSHHHHHGGFQNYGNQNQHYSNYQNNSHHNQGRYSHHQHGGQQMFHYQVKNPRNQANLVSSNVATGNTSQESTNEQPAKQEQSEETKKH